MKKSVIALAALGAFAATAQAQSNVTLYGIVDAGILYVNNNGGHSLWQAASGSAYGPRWGLRVTEDLGGGLKVVSQLENGFNIFNGTLGQGGREFGRQAWVGLSSSQYGTLTMGRQYNAMVDDLCLLQAGCSGSLTAFAGQPMDNNAILGTYRSDNSVKYTSPTYRGFQAEAMYAFSNSTSFAVNRSYSVGASYSNGNLKLGAAYARLSEPAFHGDTTGAIPSDSGYSLSLTPFLVTAANVHQWGAGGTYALGKTTFGLLYSGSLFENPASGSLFSGATGSGGGSGSVRFQNVEGSVRYQFTPALLGAIAETYTHATEGSSSGNYWQTSAGVQYFLSKRTSLYANAFYQRTSNNLHAWIELTGAPSTTNTQVAAVVGIVHKF